MDTKTLLILFPSQVRGGTEEYALQVASEALAQGWQVHAAFPETPGTASIIKDVLSQGMAHHALHIGEYDEFWLETKGRHILRFFRALTLLRRLRPDVVQLNLPYPVLSPSVLLACAVLNIPTAVIFHLTPQPLPLGPKRLKAYAWAKRRNQRWIAVSQYNRRIVCETFHLAPQDITVIYNGTHTTHLTVQEHSEEKQLARCQIRRELGLAPEQYLILTVGRLSAQKGYDDIIPTVPHIVKERPLAKFLWVGEGESRDTLMAKVREYQVEDAVMFLGHRPDVPRLLHAADLFLFPTHYEGLPFALLEAMAAGVPVIASDATSIPEIIEHGEHGLLFRAKDSCSLLETLRWAFHHPETMRDLSQKAILRTEHFTQKRMLDQTLHMLQELSLATSPTQ